jgi:hypothetical protein
LGQKFSLNAQPNATAAIRNKNITEKFSRWQDTKKAVSSITNCV